MLSTVKPDSAIQCVSTKAKMIQSDVVLYKPAVTWGLLVGFFCVRFFYFKKYKINQYISFQVGGSKQFSPRFLDRGYCTTVSKLIKNNCFFLSSSLKLSYFNSLTSLNNSKYPKSEPVNQSVQLRQVKSVFFYRTFPSWLGSSAYEFFI